MQPFSPRTFASAGCAWPNCGIVLGQFAQAKEACLTPQDRPQVREAGAQRVAAQEAVLEDRLAVLVVRRREQDAAVARRLVARDVLRSACRRGALDRHRAQADQVALELTAAAEDIVLQKKALMIAEPLKPLFT
ncbi:MAG: hypothetical protein U0470_05230 [Anaerolineae bacterium]